MLPPTKVLVIGLDSADSRLLTRLSASGYLPALQSLFSRARWGTLKSPPGLADDGTWASFYTGVSPAQHGRYFYRSIMPGTYNVPRWDDRHLMKPPFWDLLSDAGMRSAVIDVPKCPLSTGINGVHVTDWRVHGRDHATASKPVELTAKLYSQFGSDTTDSLTGNHWPCDGKRLDVEYYDIFLNRLKKSAKDKLTFSTELLQHGNWDLFLVVFKEAHCVGHKFWHLIDSSHPEFSEELAARYGDTIKEIYSHLDSAIGKLIEMAGPDANVIVFSDLGMGSNYTGNFLLDEILHRLELARLSSAARLKQHIQLLALAASRHWFGRGGHVFSRKIRQFYALPNGEQSGAIRINLSGREPHGAISPGADYEASCDYLTEALLELIDPNSGKPIVDEVIRTREIYEGQHADRLPDLLVMWNRDRPIRTAASRLTGVIHRPDSGIRTGGHTADGLYIFAGPGVRAQQHAPAASIMDIAPTVAKLLGYPLHDIDGRPIPT